MSPHRPHQGPPKFANDPRQHALSSGGAIGADADTKAGLPGQRVTRSTHTPHTKRVTRQQSREQAVFALFLFP
jgi:hypothetical protein